MNLHSLTIALNCLIYDHLERQPHFALQLVQYHPVINPFARSIKTLSATIFVKLSQKKDYYADVPVPHVC